ncbi:pyridoxal 5'-phosphate synthase glutaminase subunit PdxT [Candidatus Gracilibacteria bacterium]|nr:pyridoxal 5'-phosphate synthase glutaminase subunit PdxT [Candidatus Gracilibacteria bacterium]
MTKKVGILALQGAVAEHGKMLEKIGQSFVLVKTKKDLDGITHLILPGGESTTMTKLLKLFGMWDVLEQKIKNQEIMVLGICAGAILSQRFGLQVEIDRNAYGGQQHSFSTNLESDLFPSLRGIFIRAPKFTKVSDDCCILATYEGEPVAIEDRNFLVMIFHPELSEYYAIYEYFLKK